MRARKKEGRLGGSKYALRNSRTKNMPLFRVYKETDYSIQFNSIKHEDGFGWGKEFGLVLFSSLLCWPS